MSLQEELIGPPPAKLIVDNVSQWFRTTRQTVHALDRVSISISEGEFVCLVGPSGCGKSTLLDIISGLAVPDEGTVMADNEPVLNPGRHRLVIDAVVAPERARVVVGDPPTEPLARCQCP